VRADQTAGPLAEHQVDGQDIGATEQFVFGDVGRAGFLGGFRCQVRTPRDDVHAERHTDACHSRADSAQTQYAQNGATQLQADRRLPAAGAHRKTLIDDPSARREDQRPGQLDRRLHITAGRADVNTVVLGSRHVDRRIERPRGGDHLQPWQPLDHAPRQRRALAHHAYHVKRRQALDQVALIGDVIVEDRDLCARGHVGPVGHAQRDVLIVVEDRDPHRANFAYWFDSFQGRVVIRTRSEMSKDRSWSMGAHDKVSNKIDDVGGKAKEAFGKVTGDDSTEAEGKLDQAKSSVKDAVENVKDAFKK
jgi:uncharacterized protein YjbJ (UPF0337 family)